MTSTHAPAFGALDRTRPTDVLAVGGALSALGAASVVVTSAFYVMSPPAAAGPVQPLNLAAAMSGAVAGASTLHAAGTVGIFGDLIWAVAALLIAQELGRRGRAVSAAGWIALFLSIIIFTFVDGMTGYVFPQLAAGGDAPAFEGLKRLWDMLFLLGTFAFGAGAAAALGADAAGGHPLVGRRLAYVTALVGLVGAAAAVAGLLGVAGLPADKICGASIGLGAVLFTAVSLQLSRATEPSSAAPGLER
jgi:hypothetical protein